MRKRVAWVAGLAFIGALACDDRNADQIAGVGGEPGTDTALTLLPTNVQITVGSTVQMSTNVGVSTQLDWRSSDNNVATVTSTGLVTGRGAGTATIVVRFATDTINSASATVSVTP
jgi:hypothetical protein